MVTKFASVSKGVMNNSVVAQSISLETNYSLYLIDSDQVSEQNHECIDHCFDNKFIGKPLEG